MSALCYNRREVIRVKYRLSTECGSAARLVGEERAIEYIARAGFDAFDLTMLEMAKYDKKRGIAIDTGHPLASGEYLSFVRRLRRVARDSGIVCNQTHAPHPTSAPNIRDSLMRAIECTAEIGASICIIHPQNNATVEENAQMFSSILPFAREYNVTVACENMWNWNAEEDHARPAACSTPESFVKHLDAVGDERLVACLDIGHAEMYGLGTSAPEMIEALGERLAALHVHDNDRHRDKHQIPFSMDIDLCAVAEALGRVGYSGYITLEANRFLDAYTPDNALEGLKKMYAAAQRFAKMIK